jgi:hypothetical protein
MACRALNLLEEMKVPWKSFCWDESLEGFNDGEFRNSSLAQWLINMTVGNVGCQARLCRLKY